MSGIGPPGDEELYDSYVYLLGRALIARQEAIDLAEEGVDYNVLKLNSVGEADFANPNLDVAYLEAWVAVDEEHPASVTVPEIRGRYYTVQLSDEWGDVIANVNERTLPQSPFGEFLLHAPNGRPEPTAGVPIRLHSNKAKLLARVEIGDDLDGALELQSLFALHVDGKPKIGPLLPIPAFSNAELPGVELFDHAEVLLTRPADPVAALRPIASRVRRLATDITSDAEVRAEVAHRLKEEIVPRLQAAATGEVMPVRNGWLLANGGGRYGADYHVRTAQNLVGIWANDAHEVVYYVGTEDADGRRYAGGRSYSLRFPAADLPSAQADSYWSLILVDLPGFRVVPNSLDRHHLNSYSQLEHEADGSLQIDVSPNPPPDRPATNWLPSPADGGFSLTLRTYVPREDPLKGSWFPPALSDVTQPTR